MTKTSTFAMLMALALFLLAVLAACGGSAQPAQGTSTPAIDAASLVETRCTVCHALDRIQNAGHTAAQWEQTVTRMIGHGAQITAAEKPAVVAYLASTYGP